MLDNVNKKLKTVDHAFEVVDKVTDSISLINDRMVDVIVTFIANIFSKRKEKKEKEEEF